jgi:hypothetical protein
MSVAVEAEDVKALAVSLVASVYAEDRLEGVRELERDFAEVFQIFQRLYAAAITSQPKR